jgi:IBR domain, a half RING-finger domain
MSSTIVAKPMATVTEKTRPLISITSQQSRESSWNSAIPSQKSGTPISTKSQQSQETSWNLVTPNYPTPAAKVTSPGHPAAPQGNRKSSWSSVSTAELDGRPTFITTQQSPQPSRPFIVSDHPITTTDGSLRQQPAFNLAELGKFPSEHGVGSAFALPGRSEEFGHGTGIARTRISDSLNPFSSLRFANDPSIPAKSAQFPSMILNDPRQPFLNSSQTIPSNQIRGFSNNLTERRGKNDEIPNAEVENALRLAAGIAQQFAGFTGKAEPNGGLSPDNLSAPFVSGNRPFHERHLDATRPSGDVSQGHYVPFQMENQNGMSMQGVGPFNARRDLPNRSSQDHHAFGPLGGQNGIISNQLKPLGFESENCHSTDHHFGQPMVGDRSRGNEGFAEARLRTRDIDDARTAQIIADRADRAELETLQRMQDEWNREDDMRLAKQQEVARRIQDEWNSPYAQEVGSQQRHSHPYFQPQTRPGPRQREWSGQSRDPISRRDPIPWNTSRQDSEDSIEFAPAPDEDESHLAVAKNPQKLSPSQAQRLAPAQRNFDAAKAAEEEIRKYEAAHREREEKARQAQLEKDEADKAAKVNQANCTACGDPSDKAKMAVLACAHAYDGDCIAQAFQHALAGGKFFHCCNKAPVPIDLAVPFLSVQFVTTYKAKMLELATPNPIYCAAPGCSTFIPTSDIKGDMSTCPACSFVTCRLCKNPEHRGLCPPDKNGKKLLDLASNKNWRQCRRCNVVVERDEGCLHITCTCGYEFCYSCGGLWNQCGGECPRSY